MRLPTIEEERTQRNNIMRGKRSGPAADPTNSIAQGRLGNLERCTREYFEGWAFDPTNPTEPVELDVLLNGRNVGILRAERYRRDLQVVGFLGEGRCSFYAAWSAVLSPYTAYVVDIRWHHTGEPLPGSPVTLPAAVTLDDSTSEWVLRLVEDTATHASSTVELEKIVSFLLRQVSYLLDKRTELGGDTEARSSAHLSDRWTEIRKPTSPFDNRRLVRPQALFIDEEFPSRQDNAGANAALDHMRSLRRIGCDVYFAAAHDFEDSKGAGDTLRSWGVNVLAAPWYSSVEEVFRRQRKKLDLIYLHRAAVAAAYARLARFYCPEAVIVYGVADLHYLRIGRQAILEGNRELKMEAEKLEIAEMSAAHTVDVIITHSDVEAKILQQRIPRAKIFVVPWAVPLPHPQSRNVAQSGVLFVGNFGHGPNIDALRYLAFSILPWIRKQAPEIEFKVVGSHMPPGLAAMTQPGLEVIGSVDDLDAVFRTVKLSIAPLRFGAGIKGKVIESLAAGIPCIGTPIAFEGINVPKELDCCIAETGGELGAALVQLHRDDAKRSSIAAIGQRFALMTYSEAAVDACFYEALKPLLARWAGTK